MIDAPSSRSRWDVPGSEVSELDSTQQARATYVEHKLAQAPLLQPHSKSRELPCD